VANNLLCPFKQLIVDHKWHKAKTVLKCKGNKAGRNIPDQEAL